MRESYEKRQKEWVDKNIEAMKDLVKFCNENILTFEISYNDNDRFNSLTIRGMAENEYLHQKRNVDIQKAIKDFYKK